jgi:hypothetical protein
LLFLPGETLRLLEDVMMILAARIFAQRVETIFEKDVDFGKYKTYQL